MLILILTNILNFYLENINQGALHSILFTIFGWLIGTITISLVIQVLQVVSLSLGIIVGIITIIGAIRKYKAEKKLKKNS